jgi:Cu(I)/Ag(I) efflux system membrane fusion protein
MKRLLIPGEGKRRTRWFVIVCLIVAAVLATAGWLYFSRSDRAVSTGSRITGHESRLYTCPMHPTYTSDHPGTCPICGMTLVPVEDESDMKMDDAGAQHAGHEAEGRAAIKVTDAQRQMIGVKISPATIRNLAKEIRTVGIVAYDPDLVIAQREYVDALRLNDGSLALAAAERLELMGMGRNQIAELRRTRRVQKNLYLTAPGGKAWVYGDIYEADIPYVKSGQEVEVTVPGSPDVALSGTIAAIDPVVKPMTRTMRVRTEVSDPTMHLKPNLYVDVALQVPLGDMLSVPTSALIWSDGAWHVFVDEGDGRLVPRHVTLGGRTSDYAQVASGLSEGEKVVESANFLIDAESQLKATLKSMKGKTETKGMQGHQHGQ